MALWPDLWLRRVTTDAAAAAIARTCFAIVGPVFAFLELGQALYFATQGSGTMTVPRVAGITRMLVTAGGGTLAVHVFAAPLSAVFAAAATSLTVFAGILALSVLRGAHWHPER